MSKQTGAAMWLASYPKSGNTWVRMFLASYLCGGIEIDPNNLPRDLTYADGREWDYHQVSPYPINALGSVEILMLRQAAFLSIISRSTSRPILIKTHCANAILDDVRLFLPQVTKGAIHIVRDPRDVLTSFAKWQGVPVDQALENMLTEQTMIPGMRETSKTLFQYLGRWDKHVASWMDNSSFPVTTVRYEDLLGEPRREAKRIIEGIGWTYDEDRAARALSHVSFGKMKAFEEKHGFREKPKEVDHPFFREGKIGGWRDFLTPEQSGRVETEFRETMTVLGYEL